MRRIGHVVIACASFAVSGAARAQFAAPGTPHTARAEGSPCTSPSSRAGRLIRQEGALVIAAGDSFAIPNVSTTTALLWELQCRGCRLQALGGGASELANIVQGLPDLGVHKVLQSSSSTDYGIMCGSPLTLPLRAAREIRPTQAGRLMRTVIWNSTNGPCGGAWTRPDDTLAFTPILWTPDPATCSEVAFSISTPLGEAVQPFAPAPGFWAGDPVPVPWRDGKLRVDWEVASVQSGALYSCGGFVTRQGPGFAFVNLSDVSWSYAGFGADRAATDAGQKVFTREAEAQWLRAVFDAIGERPVVFVWHLAAEPGSHADIAADMEAMIDQAELAVLDAGVTEEVHHLLLMPHMHTINAELRLGASITNDCAARDVASGRADVETFSIGIATGYVLFDGSPVAAAKADELGWNDGGDYLDMFRLHTNETGAGHFARLVADYLCE